MGSMSGTRIVGAAILAGAMLLGGLPAAARAQDIGEVADKLERVERDLRELQYDVYKGNPPPQSASGAGLALAGGPPGAARLNDLEQSLRELRGQVETLTFEMKRLNEQLEFARKETAYRLGALEGGAPASAIPGPGAIAAAGPAAKGAPLRTAPAIAGGGSNLSGQQPGTLGSIQGTDASADAGAVVTPRQQYDVAMDLLTRAQYPEAQGAFRTFVAANPKDDLAGPAQFWVGDIAFTQKDYPGAAKAFTDVLKRFGKTAKAPEAMLKLGLSLMEMGKTKESCMTLGAIKGKYPTASKATLDRAAKRAAEAKCT